MCVCISIAVTLEALVQSATQRWPAEVHHERHPQPKRASAKPSMVMQRTRVISVLVLVSTLCVADAATAIVQGVHREGKLACLATTSSATPPA